MFRWLAPEITIHDGIPHPPIIESKEADVFALGMVAVEVFTGEVPFGEILSITAALSILEGLRPSKPQNAGEVGLTDEMWKAIQKCWRKNPDKRPKVAEVVEQWQNFVGGDDGHQQTHVTSESGPPPSGKSAVSRGFRLRCSYADIVAGLRGSFNASRKLLEVLIRNLR